MFVLVNSIFAPDADSFYFIQFLRMMVLARVYLLCIHFDTCHSEKNRWFLRRNGVFIKYKNRVDVQLAELIGLSNASQ